MHYTVHIVAPRDVNTVGYRVTVWHTYLPLQCDTRTYRYTITGCNKQIPWTRVPIKKPASPQLVKIKTFPALQATRRFITAFTNALHLSLFSARSIQTKTCHPTSWRSILIQSQAVAHNKQTVPLFKPQIAYKNHATYVQYTIFFLNST